MLALRIIVGLGLAYTLLLLVAWLFQDRLAFPAPRAKLPDPKRLGVENGERVELVSGDGTKLVGWYLTPKSPTSAGLLWFYGNGETVAAIWPVVRAFQPPGTALLVLDYPGYGGSGGRATEAALYAAADAAYDALATRPGVDPQRIYVYGRSLGSAAGPVKVVLIHGSGHNDTYDIGGRSYREKVWEFVAGTSAVGRTGGRPDRRP